MACASAREPVAERLDNRARLHEALADGRHDPVCTLGVAVDADGLDAHVDGLARDRANLALQDHAHRLIGGPGGVGDEGVLAELARYELTVIRVDTIGEALGSDAH